ncbi:efflux transporter outer membrane subunit [Desulfonema magnum]|uniref:Efflux transporter, RND family n=1 Tax=Desulfonema magnum TaxID=45655 RepID=A0A975BH69_9BACT|nr:efflux transporter outer membrane subunit [Desulfonema magnum]QTA85669.1 Efflux transporter, RND family [Desulfonema magnum]
MSEKIKNRYERRVPGRYHAIIILIGLLVLAGCATVGPDYVPPELQLPKQWNSISGDAQKQNAKQLAKWWEALNDPMLTSLINRAAADNLDIKEARSRVRQARLQRLKTKSSLFPMLDASGAARKSYNSNSRDESELYTAGFDAGWELDLFGGIRRAVEASQADLEAENESLHDVMVTLLAEVAVNYIDLRTYQARLTVAKSNVASQQETWELLNALSQAGRGDELALTQARYNLESSRSRIPDLNTGLEAAINRLSVLIGQAPGSLRAELADVRPIPSVSIELAVGVPADVIRQRPDIRQAERELAAQTARIGEAEADLYPKFTLSGSIGLEALSLDKLFSSTDQNWAFGPSFSWPIFNADNIRNNVKVQAELQNQAFIRYEAAVLSALEDIENALVTYANEQQKLKNLQIAADAARSAAELAEQQYTTGMVGFSDVLDAQRSLLSFENDLVETRGSVLSDLIRLYKALGGGWQSISNRSNPSLSKINKG